MDHDGQTPRWTRTPGIRTLRRMRKNALLLLVLVTACTDAPAVPGVQTVDAAMAPPDVTAQDVSQPDVQAVQPAQEATFVTLACGVTATSLAVEPTPVVTVVEHPDVEADGWFWTVQPTNAGGALIESGGTFVTLGPAGQLVGRFTIDDKVWSSYFAAAPLGGVDFAGPQAGHVTRVGANGATLWSLDLPGVPESHGIAPAPDGGTWVFGWGPGFGSRIAHVSADGALTAMQDLSGVWVQAVGGGPMPWACGTTLNGKSDLWHATGLTSPGWQAPVVLDTPDEVGNQTCRDLQTFGQGDLLLTSDTMWGGHAYRLDPTGAVRWTTGAGCVITGGHDVCPPQFLAARASPTGGTWLAWEATDESNHWATVQVVGPCGELQQELQLVDTRKESLPLLGADIRVTGAVPTVDGRLMLTGHRKGGLWLAIVAPGSVAAP